MHWRGPIPKCKFWRWHTYHRWMPLFGLAIGPAICSIEDLPIQFQREQSTKPWSIFDRFRHLWSDVVNPMINPKVGMVYHWVYTWVYYIRKNMGTSHHLMNLMVDAPRTRWKPRWIWSDTRPGKWVTDVDDFAGLCSVTKRYHSQTHDFE